MRVSAFYFSGTGNTEYCMKYLNEMFFQRHVVFNSYNILDFETDYTNIISNADAILICYPIYNFAPPMVVNNFVDTYENVFLDKDIMIIATQSFFSGDGADFLGRRLIKLGAHIVATEHIKMPNNLSDKFSNIKNGEETKKLIERANRRMEEFSDNFVHRTNRLRGSNFFCRTAGRLARLLFKPINSRLNRSLRIYMPQCGFCLTCVKNCPTKNIVADNGKLRSLGKCTLCYRCVNNCPFQAISIYSKSKPKIQYKGVTYDPKQRLDS